MMARPTRPGLQYPITYAVVGEPQVVIPCGGFDWANFAMQTPSTTGALTFVGSACATGPWAAIGSGVTLVGQACTGPVAIGGIAYIGVKCSTADTGKTGTLCAFLSEGA